MRRVVWTSLGTLASVAATTQSAEWPDPNPAPNSDGSWTWYVGNNTQYPILQSVLDACGDGDDIVVATGLYVESLEIDNADITLRPACTAAGTWADVTFWNPTEGFENDNIFALRTTGAANTYIGRPRQLKQLPNEYIEPTLVVPGEWDPAGAAIPVHSISENTSHAAFTFWSRSIDDVAILSEDGQATFQDCLITSSDGFGGGVMCTGPATTTQFIDCVFTGTFAGGQPYAMNEEPVCVITVNGGRPAFHGCSVSGNEAGLYGVIRLKNDESTWHATRITENQTAAGEGTVYCTDAAPAFNDCLFANNVSREGTIYMEADGLAQPVDLTLTRCNFENNTTSGTQYGGVLLATCEICNGQPPRVCFSACGFDGNNGATGLGIYDIETPWFPEYRIAADLSLDGLIPLNESNAAAGDIDADGNIDQNDLNLLMSMLGTCRYDGTGDGAVLVEDLLELISMYGVSCP
ncbi:MAG: hypothetical protein GY894_10890 [Planctomycetes bacterium]|nr:hypothetical protein [Planctomycetota bacterium]MCP4839843.1 hypothetical protein [Planctomycetota bacterium]